jgi:hypothetical protein
MSSNSTVKGSRMVARRSRAQPSSPATGSAASTPNPGRRLTPASATPTKRKSVKTEPKAKSGAKDSKKRMIVAKEDADEEDDEPPTPSENSSSSDNESGDAFDPDSSASDEEVAEDEEESEVDSDFLDESEEEQRKRKSNSGGINRPVKKSRLSNVKGKQAVQADVNDEEEEEDEDADASEVELEDGQVIAGRIYPAPTTGQGMSLPFGRPS